MLGNDIVDLNLAKKQSNWRRKNYLSKIFSPAEQQLVQEAKNPDLVVWLLWSMKEAAYKIVNRKTNRQRYDPLAFGCTFTLGQSQAQGMVRYEDQSFSTCSTINTDFIFTLCIAEGINFEDVNIINDLNRPDYMRVFNDRYSDLKLGKNEKKLPEIYNFHTQTNHMATVSHHGDHLAIAYLR